MNDLLHTLIESGGSDLHMTVGESPRIRIHGLLKPLGVPPLDEKLARGLVYSILSQEQIDKFEAERELDLGHQVPGIGRFRVNVCYQRHRIKATFRTIFDEISSFERLGLPRRVCEKLCGLPKGLVLVTGATGSGKSTTLAAMINFINETEEGHIVTIEDPIEFLHQDKHCVITQREIGTDTHGFSEALRRVLRQDPDTVLIGEMRDMETASIALEVSETGHLTFATLHTSDAVQTINRVVDMFPSIQQDQIRTQLSFTIEGIICQTLVRLQSGKGRCPALEILLTTPGVRANIREDKVHQVYSIMQTSIQEGMITMNMSLLNLVRMSKITPEEAMAHSARPEEFLDLVTSAHIARPSLGGGNTRVRNDDAIQISSQRK